MMDFVFKIMMDFDHSQRAADAELARGLVGDGPHGSGGTYLQLQKSSVFAEIIGF